MSAPLSFPRNRIRVVLLEGVHDSAVEQLQSRGYTRIERYDTALDDDELRRAIADAHLVGIRSRTQLSAEAIEDARRLVAIGCFCIGTNQVDVDAAAHRGVPVFNAPHSNTRSVAELVIGLTVMLMRDVFAKSLAVHEGRWPKSAKGSRELRGKTMGIIGYGHIGSQVSILAEALGMNVVFYDIVDKLPLGNAQRADSLTEVLLAADVVTLHVPQTVQTAGMMNQARLRSMRRGAYLVNTSRGVVVDQPALAEVLSAGHLAGAAVDVFPTEPASNDLALDSPLRGVENVVLTPHVAGSTEEAQNKIGLEVASKLMRFSDSGATVGAVNFPELTLAPHEGAHRILHIHRNVPGVLSAINRAVAGEGINVLAQHLETQRDIGYVVLDIESEGSDRLFDQLRSIDGTIRARILY
jgi:D-3-phosphoglycerate dehydrogenase